MDEIESEASLAVKHRAQLLAVAGQHLEGLYQVVSELGALRYVTRRPIGQMHSKLLSAIGVVKAYVGALHSWHVEETQQWLTQQSDEQYGRTQ